MKQRLQHKKKQIIMNKETATTHVIIHGRVQGVGYRAWTIAKAQSLGLTGWVRNRSDGTVEAVFCGARTNVNAMINACRNGPALARVDGIKTALAENKGWDTFNQKDTI